MYPGLHNTMYFPWVALFFKKLGLWIAQKVLHQPFQIQVHLAGRGSVRSHIRNNISVDPTGCEAPAYCYPRCDFPLYAALHGAGKGEKGGVTWGAMEVGGRQGGAMLGGSLHHFLPLSDDVAVPSN